MDRPAPVTTTPLMLVFASIWLHAFVFLAVARAANEGCTPDGDVCGTVLDSNSEESVGTLRLILRAAAELPGDIWGTVVSHPLTTSIVFLLAIFSVPIFVWIRSNHGQTRTKSRKDFRVRRKDPRMALLKQIDTTAADLQEGLDRIQDILHRYSDGRLGIGEPEESADVASVLKRIAREVLRVSNGLSDVRRDAASVQTVVATSSPSLERGATSARRSERVLAQRLEEIEEREDEIRNLNRKIELLTRELNAVKAESVKAAKLRREAEDLLSRYTHGLPMFLEGREDGAHFATFMEFLSDANSKSPSCVTRLAMMLRVIADAITREDNNFEVVWSVHEVGKALYSLMQSLGHNDAWQYEEASGWAHALNKFGAGRFTVFIPVAKSAFNGMEMTGGTPQSLIQEVKSWGVRNRRGDIERKAVVK